MKFNLKQIKHYFCNLNVQKFYFVLLKLADWKQNGCLKQVRNQLEAIL